MIYIKHLRTFCLAKVDGSTLCLAYHATLSDNPFVISEKSLEYSISSFSCDRAQRFSTLVSDHFVLRRILETSNKRIYGDWFLNLSQDKCNFVPKQCSSTLKPYKVRFNIIFFFKLASKSLLPSQIVCIASGELIFRSANSALYRSYRLVESLKSCFRRLARFFSSDAGVGSTEPKNVSFSPLFPLFTHSIRFNAS